MVTNIKSAEPLTQMERLNLIECEEIIARHLHGLYDVGFALMQIRDSRLYRATHPMFEQYCKERWGFSRPRAYQLIKSAEVHDTLSTMVDILVQAISPVTKLPTEKQQEIFEKAVATAPDGNVTVRHVEKTVKLQTNADQTEINPNPPRMGASFKAAWDSMEEEIARENLAGWQETDRHVAMEYVRKLLDRIVSYTLQSHKDRTDDNDDQIKAACRCGQ